MRTSSTKIVLFLSAGVCALLAAGKVGAQTYTWNVNNLGNWNNAANWSPNSGFPNAAGAVANLQFNITASRTVTIPAAAGVTVGELNIGDTVGSGTLLLVWSPFVIASGGAGGTLTFDAASGNAILKRTSSTLSAAADNISAPVILKDNLDVTVSGTFAGLGSLSLSGGVSETGGPRGLSKAGAGLLILSGANTYSGPTTLSAGITRFATQNSLYNNQQGSLAGSWNANNLVVESGALAMFNVGGSGEFTTSDIQTISNLGTATGGFKNGAIIGVDTSNAGGNFTYSNSITDTNGGANSLGFRKQGTNTLVLTAANTYSGNTTLAGGITHFTKQVTFYNNQQGALAGSWVDTKFAVNSGATALFSVGGAGEFTQSDMLTLVPLGTASGGFLNGSTVGFDTTNAAGGEFVYNAGIANPNGGSNLRNLRKNGTNTLTLVGNHTYTGTTTVDGGTLKLSGGSHSTPANNYSIANAVGTTAAIIFDGVTVSSNGGLVVGENGAGTATQNGGSLQFRLDNAGTNQSIYLGFNAGSSGDYTMNSGSLSTTAEFYAGTTGSGTFTQNDGTVAIGTFASFGRNASAAGTYTHAGGSFSTVGDLNIADYGVATMTQSGGSIVAGGWFVVGYQSSANGTVNFNGGTLDTPNWVAVGLSGIGAMTQNGGTITVNTDSVNSGAFGVGVNATGSGTFTQNHGTVTVLNDWFVTGIDGIGNSFQNNDAVINCSTFALGQNASGNGTFTMNAPAGSITTATNGQFYIGDAGIGTFNLQAGTVTAGVSGTGNLADVRIANSATGKGTFNQSGGTMSVADQTYVGFAGIGAYNMSGGTYTAGDNVFIGQNAGSVGTMTMTAGTVNVLGNDPSFTGNFIVGNSGSGTLNMNGGLIDLVVGPTATNTNNSYSYSIANNASGAGHELDRAQDGNLYVGRVFGTGTLNQTAGTIRVGANVSVGAGDAATLTGTTGTVTMTGGQMIVGYTSPTGGDLVLGLLPSSNGTFNLNGGTLDVTRGSGKIGVALGTVAFNFTGGTLKTKEYNAGDFGGNLGGLVQTGATSVLDVTTNSTVINGSYSLTDGTVQVAKLLTVTGTTNLSSAGNYQWQLGALSTSNPGTDFGQIVISTDVVLGGTSTLTLDFGLLGATGPDSSNAFWAANHLWKIVDAGTNPGSTNFASLVNATFASGTFTTLVGTGADLGDIFLHFTTALTVHPGDFDSDGDVDGADFVAWQSHFQTTSGATRAQGDADGDGDVDGADFIVWQSNFPYPSAPGASPVPEPATIMLAAISAVGLLALRRRK